MERQYLEEQAQIDLEIARIRLSAVRGEISVLEAQDRIDEWIRINNRRLVDQAELAAELDRISPILEEPSGPSAPDPVMDGAPEAARFAELSDIEESAMEDLRSRAEGVELQGLIDAWATGPEGSAVLEEKIALWNKASARYAATVRPVPLEVSEDAPDAEVDTLDIQERMVRRIHEIRAANPDAGPLELQDLIDARRAEFDADVEEITALMQQANRVRAEAEVARLEGQVGTGPAPPDPGPARASPAGIAE